MCWVWLLQTQQVLILLLFFSFHVNFLLLFFFLWSLHVFPVSTWVFYVFSSQLKSMTFASIIHNFIVFVKSSWTNSEFIHKQFNHKQNTSALFFNDLRTVSWIWCPERLCIYQLFNILNVLLFFSALRLKIWSWSFSSAGNTVTMHLRAHLKQQKPGETPLNSRFGWDLSCCLKRGIAYKKCPFRL